MTSFDDLIKLIYQIKDKELLEDLLLGVTTPHERKVMVCRIEIIKRLLAGETQHEIASDLKVGVSTVTRGAKELALGRFKIMRRP